MGDVSTFWAPVHRALARWNAANAASSFPPNAAPSMDYLSAGMQDHRLQYNRRGSSLVQPGIMGWYGGSQPTVAKIVPAAAATANIAALANVVSGTAMTLVAATGAGIVKLSSSAPAFFPTPGVSVAAGVAIESLPSFHAFGSRFVTGFYNRSTCVGRAVSITGVVSTVGGNFLVSGYDCYGYAMSEVIAAAAGVATTNGKKAFKVITSVVPQFTDAHNYSIGTADIFGIGIYVADWSDVTVWYNSVLLTAATGFLAGVATDPATTTTGDVRGTYAVQSASDGVKRLVIIARPTLGNLVTNPTTGLFGVAQA